MKTKLPTLRWSVGGILLIGILTKALGLARQLIVAQSFGVGLELDAVLLGLIVPMAIASSIGAGISKAVVPIATNLGEVEFATLYYNGMRKLFRYSSIGCIVMLSTILVWLKALSPNPMGPEYWSYLGAAVLGCLGFVGGIMAGFAAGLADAKGKHLTVALRLLFHNAITIAALILTSQYIGPVALALGFFIAEWSQLLLLAPILNKSFVVADPREHSKEWKKLQHYFWPAMLMTFAVSVNIVVDRYFAGTLEQGSISGLTYADNFLNIPVGLIGTALATPLFTRFSTFVSQKNWKGFQTTLLLGIRSLLLIGFPMGIFLALFGKPLIGLIFEHGAFDARGTELASQALWGYAPGMAFAAMTPLLISASLAAGRKWFVVSIMILMAVLNGYLDYVLSQQFGLVGIAASTTVVSGLRVLLLLLILSPKVLVNREVWICLIRVVILTLLFSLPGLLENVMNFDFQQTLWWRIGILIVAFLWVGIIVAFTWKRFLSKEWDNLGKLRNQAATHAMKQV